VGPLAVPTWIASLEENFPAVDIEERLVGFVCYFYPVVVIDLVSLQVTFERRSMLLGLQKSMQIELDCGGAGVPSLGTA